MEKIICHLTEKYEPEVLIIYGSYANGTNDSESDFDALIVSENAQKSHDTSIFEGTRLDVFIYPKNYLNDLEDVFEIIQIHDGEIIHDTDGFGQKLIKKVREYIEKTEPLPENEKNELRTWCKKMAIRAKRGDAEGLYRYHWLISDSLEIYCLLRDIFYFGPKKTLAKMESQDRKGYELYCKAMNEISELDEWINFLCSDN